MPSIHGKVAIVTGSSRGIGRGIAERLGQDGATVVVNYSGSEQEARQVVEAIESNGGKAIALQANFSQIEDIRRLFQQVSDLYGQIDILVNNAGIGLAAPIAEVTPEEYDKVFNLNVRGVLFALQEAARRMNNSGRIVNISSTTTIYPQSGMAVYAASKAAIFSIYGSDGNRSGRSRHYRQHRGARSHDSRNVWQYAP